ncbi:MAG: aldo/keto reductase [Bacteroidota bacterium]
MIEQSYSPSPHRYKRMEYRRCGKSGLKLPAISLGLWHNFGHVDDFMNAKDILFSAFDHGITHFDLANNYGPPYGSAEENFGRILNTGLKPFRDELIISTKAGYDMWPGPYGNWGSRKYIIASCNQSLKRMGLEYVDIFYHHRPDPETPLEETMGALNQLIKEGKALYIGISNYSKEQTVKAIKILRETNTPFVIHQPKYSMFSREPEKGLLEMLALEGIGAIAFSPLEQGLLTDKYISAIPNGSRASKSYTYLKKGDITDEKRDIIIQLNKLAENRSQSLAQMALTWVLRNEWITSVLVGVSSVKQLKDNISALDAQDFSPEEIDQIEQVLA